MNEQYHQPIIFFFFTFCIEVPFFFGLQIICQQIKLFFSCTQKVKVAKYNNRIKEKNSESLKCFEYVLTIFIVKFAFKLLLISGEQKK